MTKRILLAAIIAAALAVTAGVPSASAHARYKSSTPAKGEVIAASPARVEIVFTNDIQRVAGTYGIEVAKDRGLAVTAGPAVIDDADRSRASVPLQSDLGPGRYVVLWKNVSDEDGDPAEGAFSFYIQTQPNAVDLANDRQLDTIGAEDVTPAAGTPSPAATPGGTRTPAAPTRATGSATSVAPTPVPAEDEDGGGGTAVAPVLVVAAAVVVIAAAGWFLMARRRA